MVAIASTIAVDRRRQWAVIAAVALVAAVYSVANHTTVRAAAVGGLLTIEVEDHGVGGADPSSGSGLRGLVDRVAAIDGTLEVVSPRGGGTRLRARIPTGVAEGVAVAG